jgi:hypothetical protein
MGYGEDRKNASRVLAEKLNERPRGEFALKWESNMTINLN